MGKKNYRPWTAAEIEELKSLKAEGFTRRQIAESLGRSYNSVTNRIQSLGGTQKTPDKTDAAEAQKFSHITKGDQSNINSISDRIRTPAEALESANIDLDIWEVERTTVNSWEAMGKTENGLETITLWQIKVQLKRKAPHFVLDSLDKLFDRAKEHSPQIPTPKKKSKADPHLLELSLFDAHFGKLCWYPGTEYDTKKAEKLYLDAVDTLIEKTSGWNIEKILFPVGQDFFHVDNWQNTTARGTAMEVDSPFQLVFETGCMALVHAIDRCLTVAPVEILWIPGNHDISTSWYLVRFLAAWYRKSKNVKVDTSVMPRKYFHYGTNLIGFTHGNMEAHRDLPAIMAGEKPLEWSKTSWREFHLGHYHRAKQIMFTGVDEFGGVRIRVLPSLSGTDSWHYQKGYVNNKRAAEGYLWSKKDGYSGHFSANAS